MKTTPLSLKTEFTVKTDRETAISILSLCENTMFENCSIQLSNKKHESLYSTVSFEIKTTIQSKKAENINFDFIKRQESVFRNNFMKRTANLHKKIKSVKERTTITFISDEYLPKYK